MRNAIIGFLVGLSLSASVWAGSSSTGVQSRPQASRPDQLWEQDRGAAIKQYDEERQQQSRYEQDLKQLQREMEQRNHRPC